MKDKLIVEGDHVVDIIEIKQWLVYDGLLEGLPTRRINDQTLIEIKAHAKEFCQLNAVYLIEPIQEPIEYKGHYPFGEPAKLPDVGCIVKVKSYSTFKEPTKDFSELGLIWFQKQFMFPIEEDILQKIKAIPYSQLCEEFHY